MISSDKYEAAALAELAVKHGVEKVVASPGSRNAPLNIALEKKEEIEVFVIHDERSAAFFALGMAQQMGKPVMLICTSGSAGQNYAPAVSEAYYQGVPLIVVTADRPSIWVGQGIGQTIHQKNIFEPNILHSLQLFEDDSEEAKEANVRLINEALIIAQEGPVHLNISFKEPLYGTSEYSESFRYITKPVLEKNLSKDQVFHFQKRWNNSPKKLILVGLNPQNPRLNHVLAEVAEDPSCIVLVENTSNLNDKRFCHCIDRLITSFSKDEVRDFMPDLLITLGGAVISKKIKALFKDYKAAEHWHIETDENTALQDTFQSLTHVLHLQPEYFFSVIARGMVIDRERNFGLRWKQRDYEVQERHETFIAQAPFSDLKVFSFIQDVIPESSQLQMANSSVVRYCQLFDPIPSVSYYANRGTSGIDGSTSTAVGAALVKKDLWCTFITGDVAFFYDSNALWNEYLPPNLRIFLINNGGGGIFRIIEGSSDSEYLEKSFEAHHQQSAEHIAAAFNIHYYKASGEQELDDQIEDFYTVKEDERPALMEIFTPRTENPEVLKAYIESLKKA